MQVQSQQCGRNGVAAVDGRKDHNYSVSMKSRPTVFMSMSSSPQANDGLFSEKKSGKTGQKSTRLVK